MNKIIKQYVETLRKGLTFSGRASKKEFWNFTWVGFAVYFLINFIPSLMVPNAEYGQVLKLGLAILGLAPVLPGLALSVRRLHDSGKSGFVLLLGIIPLVGFILIFIFFEDGDPGENKYGAKPTTEKEGI